MPGGSISIPTKISRPLSSDTFPRTRLYHLLESLKDKPALWISGPPGSGKTALISGYIDQTHLTCIWYQMDAEDGDPSTFFYYLAKGAEQSAGKKLHVPPFTAEYYENPLSFTRWYFEQLCARISSPVVLVFDNYQELPADSVIHSILGTIISDLPPGIQLVIISRDALPHAFIRLKLNGRIGTVSWQDLQLTLDESKGILSMSGRVPEDSVPLLHEKASGWVAGLLLLEAGMDMGEIVDINVTNEGREEVFHYFAAEIFDQQDGKTRDFLLRTALLPHMTITMARDLSGLDNAAEILLTLNRRNYFVSRRPGFRSTYQYHPLFREFLLTQAKRLLPEPMRKELLENAALLLQDSGEIEEAASLFIQAASWSRLVELILEHAFSLNSQGRVRQLAEWIETLPDSIRAESPWLLYWLGVCRIFLEPWKSAPLLERAYRLFAEQQDLAGLFLSWSAIINSILFKGGSFTEFNRWIGEFDELRQDLDRMPLEIQAPVTVSMLHALGLSSLDPVELTEWVERGRQLVKQDIDPVSKAQIYNMLIMMYAFCGDLARTQYYLNIFQNFADSRQLPPIGMIQLKNCTAYFCWLAGRFDQCEEAAHSGLDIAETSGVHLYDHYFWGQLAAAALSRNLKGPAGEYLGRMAACMDRMRPWEQGYFHVLSTWAALLEENSSKALLHAEKNIRLLPEMGTPVNTAQIHLAMALAFWFDGQVDQAEHYFDRTTRLAEEAQDQQTRFSCLLARAWAALQADDQAAMAGYLRQGLALGKAQNYCNGFFWNVKVMAQLCFSALADNIEETYVRQLIRNRQIIPPAQSVILENWPWKIRIYTLGRFSLLVDDKPVLFSRKAKGRPLELLYALLALGGRNISREKLSECLWPDSLGDAAISSLSTTIQRLRKLLGAHASIRVQNNTVTLNSKLCWVDIWAFERLVSQASSPEQESGYEKSSLLQKAAALYNGLFLPELENVYWVHSMRERLQKDFSWVAVRLAVDRIQKKDYRNGCRCLERAMLFDPADEDVCRRLMECYAQAGMNAKVRQTYKHCCRGLAEQAELEPSKQTRDLYRALQPKQ